MMTTYDWSMVALIVGIAIFSGWRGFLWQVANLGSFVVGGVLVLLYGSTAAEVIPLAPPLNRVLAMVGLYAIGVLFVFVAAGVVKRALHSLGLKGADHHLGFVFGAVEGTAAALILTFVLTTAAPATGSKIAHTRSAWIAQAVAAQVGPHLPDRYRRETKALVFRLRRTLETRWPRGSGTTPLSERRGNFGGLVPIKASRL